MMKVADRAAVNIMTEENEIRKVLISTPIKESAELKIPSVLLSVGYTHFISQSKTFNAC